MIEVVKFTTPDKKFEHKYFNTTIPNFDKILKQRFIDNFKRMIGLLPQDQLRNYTVVKVRRKLSMMDDVKYVNLDLFSIKKADDILRGVSIDPTDPNVKRVIIEQLAVTEVEKNLILNYKKMIFKWGVKKIVVTENIEVTGTYTKYPIKDVNDLKRESLFYLMKKMIEKKEGRQLMIDEVVSRLSNKIIYKFDIQYKQKHEEFVNNNKKSKRTSFRIQYLVFE